MSMDDKTSIQPRAQPTPGRANQWRDLREWLELIERYGELTTVEAEVDPDEELCAVTFMGCQEPGAPAFLFSNLKGNRTDARILSNMLAASKER
jgi:UbiD family decarboxylase